ncbi:MAG: MaoC family dehydratase [Brevinema sp.]
MKFSEFKVGIKAEITKTIAEADIQKFAEVSLDFNPIHLDEEAGKNSIFGQRIAHGMISAGLISAVLGTKLPGEGAIYLGQELKFLAPVFIGDTITAICEIEELVSEKNRVILKTIVRNQDGKEVVSGKATLLKKD